jgi:transposase
MGPRRTVLQAGHAPEAETRDPFSPNPNPIEMAFAKLKALLRARAIRTIDALWRSIGEICDLFSPH